MSIQRKFMLIMVSITTIPLLVTCGLLVGFEYFGERAALVNEVETLAGITAWSSSAAVVFHDKGGGERILEGLKAEPHILAACLYDQAGLLLAGYPFSARDAACPARSPEEGTVLSRGRVALTRPVLVDHDRVGTVYLCSDLRKAHTRIYSHFRFVGFVLGAALISTFFVSARVRRAVADPILNLANVARAVSVKKDYSVRAPKAGNNEIGVLVDAFNAMLVQIARHSSELTRVNGELQFSKDQAERAAAALAESERRFRSTFDEGPIGMTLLDAEGTVLESNRSLQRMLGYSRDELSRMRIADYSHPEDAAADMAHFRDLIAGKIPRYRIQKRYLTKGGQTVWGRVTVSTFRAERGQLLAVSMTEDMTEQKRLEEQFRQAQKMEAIGRLAGGVAHDFNNLLTVIKGNTELLIRRAGETPMQKNLGQIRKAADRAAALVDQLLAFSRKQFVAPKVLDLNAAVRDMEKMLRTLIGEDIELKVDTGPEPAWVHGDPVQLGQILLNLAVNARDAMPGGGQLTILTRLLSPAESIARVGTKMRSPNAGPFVVLSVRDTGVGMSEEVRSHIFEPFFTTKEVGKGTGLGLSTVYGLVKQTGGTIEVESTPGQGSTFSICLPVVRSGEEQEAGSGPEANAVLRGRETVLIVEDEELVRATLCETLAEHGYTVLESRNTDHALDLARNYEQPIDLLVTDIVMPRMNGRDLAQRIRRVRPAIKVLYISGYTEDGLDLDAAFLKKPFTPEELARGVRDVVKGRSPAHQPSISAVERRPTPSE